MLHEFSDASEIFRTLCVVIVQKGNFFKNLFIFTTVEQTKCLLKCLNILRCQQVLPTHFGFGFIFILSFQNF